MNTPISDLETCAKKIRRMLIERAALKGGHLASSLGAVEITLALIEVFDFTDDTLFFDIGHQSHAYKILTGRKDRLSSMGEYDGISFYPDIHESPFDFYNTAHSGTASSAALGYAYLRPHAKSVVIIGDGALTSGESFEALNHIGTTRTNILIIYNDNGMSISPNVGALASGKKVKLFAQSLNLDYHGIFDGHDLYTLVPVLQSFKMHCRPVFLHIKTQKGRGFQPAENNPVGFHCPSPFTVAGVKTPEANSSGTSADKRRNSASSNGPEPPGSVETFVQRNEAISLHYLDHYDNLYFTTPAYSVWGLGKVAHKHPDRVIDTGICEQHCMTFSSALVLAGNKVVMNLASWFLARCYDQIIDVCIQNIPLTVVLSFAGLGPAGPSHQGLLNHSILKTIPNVTLMHPKSLAEYELMFAYALNASGPIFLQAPNENCYDGPEPQIEENKGVILTNGHRLTLVPLGSVFSKAFRIAKSVEGIEILNLRYLKPIDMDLIVQSVQKTKRILIVEDSFKKGGIGEEILAYLKEHHIDCWARSVGVGDSFPPQGDIRILYSQNDMLDSQLTSLLSNAVDGAHNLCN